MCLLDIINIAVSGPVIIYELLSCYHVVKLRQGSGKDRQVMALKAKGLKA